MIAIRRNSIVLIFNHVQRNAHHLLTQDQMFPCVQQKKTLIVQRKLPKKSSWTNHGRDAYLCAKECNIRKLTDGTMQH